MEPNTSVVRCDDCRIEIELFKELVGPSCPHGLSATRRRHPRTK